MPQPTNIGSEIKPQEILDVELNLRNIQAECDKQILRKVAVQNECNKLEDQKRDKEKQIAEIELEINARLGQLQELRGNVKTEEKTLENFKADTSATLSEITLERANIAQERQSIGVLRKQIDEEQGALILAKVENERIAKSNAEQLRKIKEFASLI